jgi:hypothetical protein
MAWYGSKLLSSILFLLAFLFHHAIFALIALLEMFSSADQFHIVSVPTQIWITHGHADTGWRSAFVEISIILAPNLNVFLFSDSPFLTTKVSLCSGSLASCV